jgi:hypothetical protein
MLRQQPSGNLRDVHAESSDKGQWELTQNKVTWIKQVKRGHDNNFETK